MFRNIFLALTLVFAFASSAKAAFTSTNYSTTGNYTVSWNDAPTGDTSASVAYGTPVAKLTEQKLNSGQAVVPVSLQTWTSMSVDITGKTPGQYLYTLSVRTCTSSGCTYFNPVGGRLVVTVSSIAQAVVTPVETTTAVGSTPYTTNVNIKGEATINVPINVVPGINGMQPRLSLNFNSGGLASQATNQTASGLLGFGWNLSGISSINRCTIGRQDIFVDPGTGLPSSDVNTRIRIRPRLAYNDTDSLCLDGQLLVLASGTHLKVGATYRTYTESFQLITIKGTDAEPWFEVRRPNGVIAIYGRAANSHVRKDIDLNGTSKTPYFEWSIDSDQDAFGNIVTYGYYGKNEFFSYQSNKTRIFPAVISYPGSSYLVNFQYYVDTNAYNLRPGLRGYDPAVGVDRYDYPYDSGSYHIANITVNADNQSTTYTIRGNGQTNEDIRYNGLQVGSIQECHNTSCLAPLTFKWVQTTGYWSNWNSNVLESVTDSLGAITKFNYGKYPFDGYYPDNVMFSENPFDKPASGSWPISSNPIIGYPSYDPQYDPVSYTDFVVRSVERATGLSSSDVHITDFTYFKYGNSSSNAKSHLGLGSLGFAAMRSVDRVSGVATYTQYDQTSPYDECQLSGAKLSTTLVFSGVYGQPNTYLLSKSESHNSFIKISQTNAGVTSKTYLPTVVQSSSFKYEKSGNSSVLIGATLKTNEYSVGSNGLLSQIKTTVVNGSQVDTSSTIPATWWGRSAIYALTSASTKSTQVSTTTFSNWNSATDWRIGFTNARQVDNYAGTISSFTDSKSQRSEFTPKTGTMTVDTATLFPSDTENRLVTSYVYDSKGRQASVTISGANIDTRIETMDTYPSSNTNPGRIVNALGHVTTNSEFDPRFGFPTYSVDANGLSSEQKYDSFGRVSVSRDVNGNSTTQAYISCAATACDTVPGIMGNVAPVYFKEVDSPVSPKSREYYDSLERVIRTEVQGFNGTDLIRTDVQYDNFGRVYKTSLPYKKGATAQYVTNTYDNITGRLINVSRPDGGSTVNVFDITVGSDGYSQVRKTTTENILKSDGTSAGSQIKVSLTNSAGQITQAIDASGTTKQVTTSYQYDALGNTVKTTVNGGSDGTTISSAIFDAAGNRTSVTDPNAGTVSSKYTALGQLRWMQDNKGTVTTFTYDKLGRKLSRTNTIDGTSNWTYDPTGAKGYPSTVTNNNGYTQTFYYQDANRMARLSRIETSIAVPGLTTRTYAQSVTYDVYGREQKTTSPSAFASTRRYTSSGYTESVWRDDGVYPLIFILQMGALGVEKQSLNTVTTSTAYDPKSGRIASIKSTYNTSTTLQDLTYYWRTNGSLEARVNNKSGSPVYDAYQYDAQERLTTTQTIFGVYGSTGAVRTQSQSYSNLGNILSNTSTNSADAQATSYQYTNGRPHAVSGATINGVFTQINYDANGAITSYDAAGTAQDKTIVYNSSNQPTSIILGDTTNPTARDEFLYTPDGARYYKKSTYKENGVTRTEQTIYLGNYEAAYFDSSSTLKMSEKTQVGNFVHILKTPVSGATTEVRESLLLDHQGSVDAVLNWGDSSVIANMAFEPFGVRRDSSSFTGNITSTQLTGLMAKSDQLNSKGYTGHESLDRTGLIHMNGRVYDPQLGRFLSPDPIVQAPLNSQSWNRYSYVFNNPLSYTDPTGFACREIKTTLKWTNYPQFNDSATKIDCDDSRPASKDFLDGWNRSNGAGGWQPPSNEKYIANLESWVTGQSEPGGAGVGGDSIASNLAEAAEPVRTYSSYLPGTEMGDEALSYWADQYVAATSLTDKMVAGAGMTFSAMWTKDTALPVAATLLTPSAIARGFPVVFGPLKQWIRIGPSYSKFLSRKIRLSIRWGASPARGGKYIKEIPRESMQRVNQELRELKLPGDSWRTQDPGHFHLLE